LPNARQCFAIEKAYETSLSVSKRKNRARTDTPGRWVGRLLQPQNFPRPTNPNNPFSSCGETNDLNASHTLLNERGGDALALAIRLCLPGLRRAASQRRQDPGAQFNGALLQRRTLALFLIGYGFVASVLPVWLLLAPRD
jgi:hypothetical protein